MQAFVMKDGERYRVMRGSGAGSARLYLRDGQAIDEGGFATRAEAARLVRELNEGAMTERIHHEEDTCVDADS